MPQARRVDALWLGMILAGAALAAIVYLAWPEPTFRLVRLPYGESMPKTPAAAVAPRAARTAAPTAEVATGSAPIVVTPAASPARELAVAEPESSAGGPPPVPSESEADGYTESAEELGAEPLPGMGPQPEPAANERSAAAEADDGSPLLGLVIEP